jgi:hypothetical protein
MNKRRVDFKQPEDHIITISPYWLLGFVEGEGSFSISKNNTFRLEFGISQTLSEKEVMVKIKQNLSYLPGSSQLTSKEKSVIGLNTDRKPKNDKSKPMVKIKIYKSDYIKKVLVAPPAPPAPPPFF